MTRIRSTLLFLSLVLGILVCLILGGHAGYSYHKAQDEADKQAAFLQCYPADDLLYVVDHTNGDVTYVYQLPQHGQATAQITVPSKKGIKK